MKQAALTALICILATQPAIADPRPPRPSSDRFDNFIEEVENDLGFVGCRRLRNIDTEQAATFLAVASQSRPSLALYVGPRTNRAGYLNSLAESAKNALSRGIQVIVVWCPGVMEPDLRNALSRQGLRFSYHNTYGDIDVGRIWWDDDHPVWPRIPRRR